MTYLPNAAGGPATAGAATLAATGATATAMHAVWLAVVCFLLAGMAFALAKFPPRIAIEPVRREDGRYRLRLTRNGRPWPSRRRKEK